MIDGVTVTITQAYRKRSKENHAGAGNMATTSSNHASMPETNTIHSETILGAVLELTRRLQQGH